MEPQPTKWKCLWIIRFWSGEISLVKAFWLYGAIAFTAFYQIILLCDTESNAEVTGPAPLFMHMVFAFEMGYGMIWSVAVWRSSARYEGPFIWRYLANLVVILQVITIIRALAQLYYLLFPD